MSIGGQVSLGVRALWRGATFLARHPSLWPWALLPFLLQVAIFALFVTLLAAHFNDFYAWAAGFLPTTGTEGTGLVHTLLDWLWGALRIFLQLLVFILSMLFILLATFIVGQIVAGPFNDLLSEKTEALARGYTEPAFGWQRFLMNVGRAIWIEIQKALFFLGGTLLLLLLTLVPVVGGPVALFATALFNTWAAGFTFVDYPMGRRNISFRRRMAFATRHGSALFAFGLIFWLPGAMIFCAPPLIVGGTLLYGDLEDGRPTL